MGGGESTSAQHKGGERGAWSGERGAGSGEKDIADKQFQLLIQLEEEGRMLLAFMRTLRS